MAKKLDFIKSKLDSLSFDPALGKNKNYYCDEKINGLFLVITPENLKVFQICRKYRDTNVMVLLGCYPGLSIEMARKRAHEILTGLFKGTNRKCVNLKGVNPNYERRPAKIKDISLREVFDDYLKARGSLKAGTVYDYRHCMEFHFKDWLDKPLAAVTREAVVSKHSELGNVSPASANKAMGVLRAVFNFAIGNYEIENKPIFIENPVTKLRRL